MHAAVLPTAGSKAEQPDLLKLIALVSNQDVRHAFMKEDCVEVVIPEEDGQLIGAQALPQRGQAVVCQLAGAAIQEFLQTCHLMSCHSFVHFWLWC